MMRKSKSRKHVRFVPRNNKNIPLGSDTRATYIMVNKSPRPAFMSPPKYAFHRERPLPKQVGGMEVVSQYR